MLEQRISAIDRDIRHEGMSADWSEQASERENDEVLESLGNASETELIMIKAALQRLDDGSLFRLPGMRQRDSDRTSRPAALHRSLRRLRRTPRIRGGTPGAPTFAGLIMFRRRQWYAVRPRGIK